MVNKDVKSYLEMNTNNDCNKWEFAVEGYKKGLMFMTVGIEGSSLIKL